MTAKPADYFWVKAPPRANDNIRHWHRATLTDGRYVLPGKPRYNKEGKLVDYKLVDIEVDKAEFVARLSPCCYFLTNNPDLLPNMRGFVPTDSDETTEDAS